MRERGGGELGEEGEGERYGKKEREGGRDRGRRREREREIGGRMERKRNRRTEIYNKMVWYEYVYQIIAFL